MIFPLNIGEDSGEIVGLGEKRPANIFRSTDG